MFVTAAMYLVPKVTSDYIGIIASKLVSAIDKYNFRYTEIN